MQKLSKKEYQEKTKETVQKLEAGVKEVFTSGRFQNYLDVMNSFHNYSAYNCCLLFSQLPCVSQVAGYKSWQEKKRFVKKGEKALYVLAPVKHHIEVEADETNEAKEINWLSFKPVPVFDISQTDGEDLPNICNDLTGNIDDFESIKTKLIEIAEVPVSFEEIQGPEHGWYSPKENSITIKEGMSEIQTIKTLIHEITHSVLHCDQKHSGEDKRTREVEAESVAYVVCNHLGIDSSDYSFGYVAGWSSDKNTKELKSTLEIIKNTADAIIQAYEL